MFLPFSRLGEGVIDHLHDVPGNELWEASAHQIKYRRWDLWAKEEEGGIYDYQADFQSQRYSELTQGNQGRDLLVGGLYIIVVFDLEKLKQLTIFSFPPLSLSLGCLSVCLGLFGCLEFLNIWEWNQAKWYTIFQCSNKISSITYENSSSCWLWISGCQAEPRESAKNILRLFWRNVHALSAPQMFVSISGFR